MRARIGIDLGGTKIEGIAIDDSAVTLARRRIPTPANDYAAIVREICRLIREIESETGSAASIGIGTPGAISLETGLMKNANSTVLIGKALRDDLEAALGRSIRMTNDANCLALSESFDGAAAGSRVVFGTILGTGTGGGIAIDGRALDGANGIAGEWGHNPLPWPSAADEPAPHCYCGKNGCLETYLCGPALTRQYAAASGQTLAPTAIAGLAVSGDAPAQRVLETYVDRLARGIASVINILDPDAIVFGGGVSNIEAIYEALPARLRRYVFSDSVRTKISRAAHGDSSGVRGAAMLWP